MFATLAKSVAKGVADWRSASLAPLQVPLFRTLWLAAMASNVGSVMQMAAASWAMTALDPRPGMVALVQTAAMAPVMILALPAGALADNVERRMLMLVSQIGGLLTAVVLAFLAFTHQLTAITLLICTALVGSAGALHQPAWQASFADIVPRKALPAAVGLNSLAFNVARALGPAFGGFVLATLGAVTVFVLNALSFLGLIAVLAFNKLPRTPATLPPEPVHRAMAAGLRYVAMSPVLQTIFVRGSLFGLGASALWSLAPLVAQTQLHGDSVEYGLLLGGFGIGSLLAAAGAVYVRGFVGNERLFAIATGSFALATLGVAFSQSLLLSIPLMAIAGAGWIFAFTTASTCMQLSSPRWVVGRSVALSQVAVIGSIAVGSAFWGYLAERTSLLVALIGGAVFLTVSLVGARIWSLPGQEFDDLSPLAPRETPAPLVKVHNATGPVLVTIEYQAPAEEAAAFLNIMHALGRIRRRDGARRWSVAQDLDRPDIWIEYIESATWTEHLRRTTRITVADQAIRDRAEAYRTKSPAAARRLVVRPPGSNPLTAPDQNGK